MRCCYTMDRNNPVWREYRKAIIRLQIDIGVDGVQLDEAELPLTAMQDGGCFCKDCIKGFRAYHQALSPEQRPRELDGLDLDHFHLHDEYYPLEPAVDMIITEMRNTRYSQPEWYRYVHGFAAAKRVAEDVRLTVYLPQRYKSATCYIPRQEPRELEIAVDGTTFTIFLEHVPLYSIIKLGHDQAGKTR